MIDSFNIDIFNPNGLEVSESMEINLEDIGKGHYRIGFIPDIIGIWYITVRHDMYFPWGKSGEIQVYENDINEIYEYLSRVIGLSQENYCLDKTKYSTYRGNKLLTNGRLRLYSDSESVGTESNIIAIYEIISEWQNDELKTYKVMKV